MKFLSAFALFSALFFFGCTGQDQPTSPVETSSSLEVVATPKIIVILPNNPTVEITPSTQEIWPPNNKEVSVTFSVSISDGSTVSYLLTDEYNEYTYAGTLAGTTAEVTLALKASRAGKDKDGRTYTFVVKSADGSEVLDSVTVVVPHNR